MIRTMAKPGFGIRWDWDWEVRGSAEMRLTMKITIHYRRIWGHMSPFHSRILSFLSMDISI